MNKTVMSFMESGEVLVKSTLLAGGRGEPRIRFGPDWKRREWPVTVCRSTSSRIRTGAPASARCRTLSLRLLHSLLHHKLADGCLRTDALNPSAWSAIHSLASQGCSVGDCLQHTSPKATRGRLRRTGFEVERGSTKRSRVQHATFSRMTCGISTTAGPWRSAHAAADFHCETAAPPMPARSGLMPAILQPQRWRQPESADRIARTSVQPFGGAEMRGAL